VLYTPNGTRTPLNQFTGAISAAQSDQLEVGLKWRPQKTTRLDASIFRAKTRDDIAPLFLSPSSSTWQNIDSLRQGFEINGSTQLHPQWVVRGAASWISAKVDKDFSVIQSGSLAQVANGNTMPGVPEHRGFMELAWRSKHLGNQANRVGTEAAIELHAIGPMMANSTNTARVDGAELAHLRVTHQFRVGAAAIKLFGRLENLTNERYVGSVVADQAFLRFYEPGAPRNWLVGASVSLTL
jgi:iron complex outermembrane receptor protein